jgi:XdhC and CoxI family
MVQTPSNRPASTACGAKDRDGAARFCGRPFRVTSPMRQCGRNFVIASSESAPVFKPDEGGLFLRARVVAAEVSRDTSKHGAAQGYRWYFLVSSTPSLPHLRDPLMPADLNVLRSATELHERGEAYVIVTVVSVKGSTPRNPGAKMLWHPNGSGGVGPGGTWVGTVGGGQFEMLVQDDAEKHLRARSCGIERYVLGTDADQCCGGVMEVFFEAHGPRQRVVIFGAGHVGYELARLLASAPGRHGR